MRRYNRIAMMCYVRLFSSSCVCALGLVCVLALAPVLLVLVVKFVVGVPLWHLVLL